MPRLHAVILLLALFLPALRAPAVNLQPIPSPAKAGAMGSALAGAPDGTVYLSWLEPLAGGGEWALKFSRFDATRDTWGEPREIARGGNWFINWADFPTVTPLANDVLMAVWFVENPSQDGAGDGHHGAGYHAQYSLSEDGGKTWGKPQATTGESAMTEFTTVLALHDNARALVAWLDARQRQRGGHDHAHGHRGGAMALYAQTFLADGADKLIDARVCDCCQLSLARVGDGALLAYRGRTADEIRDIRLARWRDGRWEEPRPLHDDEWKIAACPVNGPRLAAQGRNVAAIWYTGAQETPRVLMKFSTDGGDTFGDAQRLDLGRAQGRVDALMLKDGSTVFTWLEANGREAHEKTGGIYLRRRAADGTLGEPQLVAPSTTARTSGFPRLAPLPDGRRVLLTYTLDAEPTRVATVLLKF